MIFVFSDRIQRQFEEAGLDPEAVQNHALRRAGAGFRREIGIDLGEYSDRQLGLFYWSFFVVGPGWFVDSCGGIERLMEDVEAQVADFENFDIEIDRETIRREYWEAKR